MFSFFNKSISHILKDLDSVVEELKIASSIATAKSDYKKQEATTLATQAKVLDVDAKRGLSVASKLEELVS